MTRPAGPIKVLIVDDSPVDRLLLSHIIDGDPRARVLATATTGEQAIELNAQLRPDVILMDVTMPGVDGLETTRRIMETQPVPIVICSGLHGVDPLLPFRAVEAGAMTLLGKPHGTDCIPFSVVARMLVDTACNMAEVPVVRRRPRASPPAPAVVAPPAVRGEVPAARCRLVVIGTSTGGPPTLQQLLGRLPRNFPAPILVVQHIAPGFVEGMAIWLQQATGLAVTVAKHGEVPQPGHVYLAPDHTHLGIGVAGTLVLSAVDPECGHRPAVDFLFRSVVRAGRAAECAAVLLTGMGSDGANGLGMLREAGAVTLAQDAETAIVNGMPGTAVRLGFAMHVMPPEGIALLLAHHAGMPVPA